MQLARSARRTCAHGRNESERSSAARGTISWIALTFDAMLRVREDDALGVAGRAARVDEPRDVVSTEPEARSADFLPRVEERLVAS